jgi:two-component system chemotaxis response regulator CheB
MQAGALACIAKPAARAHPDFEAMAAHLVDTVKLMSEVKVVRRSARPMITPPTRAPEIGGTAVGAKVVAIGASTGGPPVIQTILAGLPRHFPVPVLIVQHIAPGFVAGMTEWLSNTTGFQVHIAVHDTRPKPGHVYVAPDEAHMGFSANGRIVLSHDIPENHVRPAVSFLFRSLVATCGAKAVGVLLTGMGCDGAAELKALKDKGAITIAQDRESSIVHGMPGAAIALGGATHVLAADKIADALVKMIGPVARAN